MQGRDGLEIAGGDTLQTANAWLEILEQILGEFPAVDNATPDWLVDPETDRRLKVDKLYPELGVAIRFKGMSHPVDLDELDQMEEAARSEVRARLCRQAGIALVEIDTDSDAPGKALDDMRTALSAAARRIAQRQVSQEAKRSLLPRIAWAKTTCQRIQNAVSLPQGLLSFAQAWEDRQFGQDDGAVQISYQPGMAVRHSEHGKGLVLRIVPQEREGDTEIVVQFEDGSMHTFSSSKASRALSIEE